MASLNLLSTSILVRGIAAGTPQEVPIALPGDGKWQLISAHVDPAETSAADATDYATLTIETEQTGGSVVGTAMTTASVALTVGTRRDFTIATGATAEFDDASDDHPWFNVAVASSGVAVAVVVRADFMRVP